MCPRPNEPYSLESAFATKAFGGSHSRTGFWFDLLYFSKNGVDFFALLRCTLSTARDEKMVVPSWSSLKTLQSLQNIKTLFIVLRTMECRAETVATAVMYPFYPNPKWLERQGLHTIGPIARDLPFQRELSSQNRWEMAVTPKFERVVSMRQTLFNSIQDQTDNIGWFVTEASL